MGLINILIAIGVVIFILFVAGILTQIKGKKPKHKQEEN